MICVEPSRKERLEQDAEYVREFLATFRPTKAIDLPHLTVDQCAELARIRFVCALTEFSKVWNEQPPMVPPPSLVALRSDWEPS